MKPILPWFPTCRRRGLRIVVVGCTAALLLFYVIASAVLFLNFWSFPFNGDAWNANFWPFLKNFDLGGGFRYIAAGAKVQSRCDAFSLAPR